MFCRSRLTSMRILHLAYSDSTLGGAIGAYRLHRSMVDIGLQSRLLVFKKKKNDPTVLQFPLIHRFPVVLSSSITKRLSLLQKSAVPSFRSLNILPTGIHHKINKMNPDMVQMHWINNNTISIAEISRIKSPVVWKLPDMWAFSGTEHYLAPGAYERYKEGYHSGNRLDGDRGFDLDRIFWKYKRWCWKNTKIGIVCPSQWLSKCAKRSVLFGNYQIRNIPNPLDTERYKPALTEVARKQLGLPIGKELVLFASFKAVGDRRKGFHHLKKCLEIMANIPRFNNVELVIMGSDGDPNSRLFGFPVHYMGHVEDELKVIKIYQSSDTIVLPTEADNLPNVIKEGTCCGIPCVGFSVGGMPDMISHRETGYLVKPFDANDMVSGIQWVLDQNKEILVKRVREKAAQLHDPKKRVIDYLEFYKTIIHENGLGAKSTK